MINNIDFMITAKKGECKLVNISYYKNEDHLMPLMIVPRIAT